LKQKFTAVGGVFTNNGGTVDAKPNIQHKKFAFSV
jgi:hypothetical protein